MVPLLVLAGCGSHSGESSMPGSSPPPAPDQGVDHGRYVGTVTIDGMNYFGDALLAPNGETHVYIGGPYVDDGTIQLASPEGSIDFVSPARTPSGNTVSGGVIGREGEDCGQRGSPSARWCGRGSSAAISVEREGGGDTGSIQGEITGHGETWTFDLAPWRNYYGLPARMGDLVGQYDEVVAPFARNGMVLTIDEDGRAFFQTPYLCTGNGIFVPHGNGNVNVFDVEMTISSCDYPYSHYNGEYRGLATLSPSDYWGSDTNLRVWLRGFSPDWSAVTMWGIRLSGNAKADAVDFHAQRRIADADSAVVLQPRPAGGNAVISEGVGQIDFEVRGSIPGTQLFTVDYRTINGSAKPGKDDVAVAGKLTWFDGNFAVHRFSVRIIDDNRKEPSESFQVELRNPKGIGSIENAQLSSMSITIEDDDGSVDGGPGPSPGPGPGNGGGGGAAGLELLLLLALLGDLSLRLQANFATGASKESFLAGRAYRSFARGDARSRGSPCARAFAGAAA